MTIRAYLFDISRATDAGTLHAYRADAVEDDTLTSFEKTEVCAAIDRRFHELNKAAAGKQKARWS
jgi:hypothetical protein